MAGSLNHIIDDNGRFDPTLCENLKDCGEALEECFEIIFHLTGGKKEAINKAIKKCHVLTKAATVRRDMVLERGEY